MKLVRVNNNNNGGSSRRRERDKNWYISCLRGLEIFHCYEKDDELINILKDNGCEISFMNNVVISTKWKKLMIYVKKCDMLRKVYEDRIIEEKFDHEKILDVNIKIIGGNLFISKMDRVISIDKKEHEKVTEFDIVNYFLKYPNQGIFQYKNLKDEYVFFLGESVKDFFKEKNHQIENSKGEKIELKYKNIDLAYYFKNKAIDHDFTAFDNECKRNFRMIIDKEKIGMNSNNLSIVTYNLLAMNCTDFIDNFLYCRIKENNGREFLEWEFRKKKIVDRLINLNSDIICLQENFPDISSALEENYVGKTDTYSKCSILYKKDVVRLVKYKEIDFNNFVNSPTCKRVLQIATFEKDDQKFTVLNTHIHHSDNVAEFQTTIIIKEIKDCITENVPTFMCGDFNVEPDSKIISYFKELLSSAYKLDDKHPTFLSEHPRHIDYIFHPENIELVKILELPKVKMLLPNKLNGSDHIPLFAEFSLGGLKEKLNEK